MGGFRYDPGEPPDRPRAIRRLTHEDVWYGREHAAAAGVVPLARLQPGDRQAGVFAARGDRPGRWGAPVTLDRLAAAPTVESVVGAGPVIVRTPLPHVHELAVGMTDDETLRNLPNLRWLSIASAIDGGPLQIEAVAESLRWLGCASETFGTPEAVATRFPQLERLRMHGLWRSSPEPLAAFGELRWLWADPGKGLQHLAALEKLEVLNLELADGPRLANLKRFRSWSRLRVLWLTGSGVQSLDGIDQLRTLEELALRRVGVDDLGPLAGLPALHSVDIEHPSSRLREIAPLGELPALRRLRLFMGDGTGDQTLSSLKGLAGARALEELELTGVVIEDADPRSLYALPRLRRAKLVGRFGADETALRTHVPADDLDVVVTPGAGPGTEVGPVHYRRLPDGSWTIFANVADALATESNVDAEDRVRGAIRDEDLDLHDRLTFDSEPGALAIVARSEEDIRRAAEVVASLAEGV